MMKLSARTTYFVISAAASLCFATAFTTSAIYRFQLVQLNPLQLVLVGTVLEMSVFVLEIPTGIVADVYSRRMSVIIGYGLIGLGLIIEGSFPLFATILLAQFIWGTGFTFTSGALDAWLADELGEENLTQIYLRGSQFAQASAFVGIVTGVSIATIRLDIPYLVGGGGLVALALFLVLFMPESGFAPVSRSDRSSWNKMGVVFKEGMGAIRLRPLLITILVITFVGGLYSEAVDRLWEAHFLESFEFPGLGALDAFYWFALINGGTMIITIVATEFVRRRVDRMDHRTAVHLLLTQSAVIFASLFAFGIARGFATALAAYGLVAVIRSTGAPIYSAWVNRGIEPNVRATVLSTISQMDAVGQVIGGPFLGSIATRLGLRAAMIMSSMILLPLIGLYARAARQGPAIVSERRPEVDL